MTNPMIDARERVDGSLDLILNLERPGMLHAAMARSIVPHAKLSAVDTSAAERVPGVHRVFTGADIVALEGIQSRFGPVFRDQPLLAIDRVRYVGEPIAAVVAETPEAAAEAAMLVDAEYDELPAVFDMAAAMKPDAPLIHEVPEQSGPTFADIVINRDAGRNVCNQFMLRRGDVDKALAEAAHVFEDTFTTPAVQHVSLEPHVCVAEVEADGGLGVWANTQTPHHLVRTLAEVLDRPESDIRVRVTNLGGAYGGKCYPKIEPLTTVLAILTDRPVRIALTREEEFVTTSKHASEITLTTGLDADGKIVARRARCLFNTGAYADIGPRVIKNGGYGSPGPYAIPNVWVDSYAVYTNLPSAGAFRGYGQQQAAWAYETQMDMIAERLDIDPLELRLRNLIDEGGSFHTGEPIHDARFKSLMREVADKLDWPNNKTPRREGSRVRATGFSCAIKGSVTPSRSDAAVTLERSGQMTIQTSSVEMGQGLRTVLADLVRARLGNRSQPISVSDVDTSITPYDQQTSSSRSTHCMGNAVLRALEDLLAKLRSLCAEQHGVAADSIELAEGVLRLPDGTEAALGEVVERAGLAELGGEGTFVTEGGLDSETGQGVAAAHWHQTAGAAEVEVDLETGMIKVLHYHTAAFAGSVVNRTLSELQCEGNVTFGLGQALFEEMDFDYGQLSGANLGEYQVISFEDMPEKLSVSLVEGEPGSELHGLGETALPAVCPAIGNAVSRAIGVRLTDLPLTPEKVLRAIGERAKRHPVGVSS